MSDLFDSPEWSKVMGPATRRLTRIGLVGCVDGIPCFRIGGLSLMPSEFFIANLPPEHRTKAGNMIMHMLLDSTLTSTAMRKYYKFAAEFEMNQLRRVGVDGVRIILFANTMDTKGVCVLCIPYMHTYINIMHPIHVSILGREKHCNMQTCQSYTPCLHCLHENDTPIPGFGTQLVFDGFRRWLPRRHPLRARSVDNGAFQYRNVEIRGPAVQRNHNLCLQFMEMTGTYKNFMGHKGLPMMHEWSGYNFGIEVSDIMHDEKLLMELLYYSLLGGGS